MVQSSKEARTGGEEIAWRVDPQAVFSCASRADFHPDEVGEIEFGGLSLAPNLRL